MDFTAEEREYILELLKTAHAELLHELHHTDTRSFEQVLKERVALNEKLTSKLTSSELVNVR